MGKWRRSRSPGINFQLVPLLADGGDFIEAELMGADLQMPSTFERAISVHIFDLHQVGGSHSYSSDNRIIKLITKSSLLLQDGWDDWLQSPGWFAAVYSTAAIVTELQPGQHDSALALVRNFQHEREQFHASWQQPQQSEVLVWVNWMILKGGLLKRSEVTNLSNTFNQSTELPAPYMRYVHMIWYIVVQENRIVILDHQTLDKKLFSRSKWWLN